MKVTVDYNPGPVVSVPVSDYAPAAFASGGTVAALDENYGVIGASNPASRGKTVQLYFNGLGPVNNQPATGEAPSAQTLSRTTTLPTVTIGNVNAAVQFSGLAPGYPGLYQVNVTVPTGAPVGTQPVILSIGGQSSPAVNIPVQ
jgi:uncharacterized protein (TIGR03437 family)